MKNMQKNNQSTQKFNEPDQEQINRMDYKKTSASINRMAYNKKKIHLFMAKKKELQEVMMIERVSLFLVP